MDRLRITFKKGQNVKYISHLDLLRTFIRAIRRAQIPVKYSKGFNPHAQITFAMPLSVGVTSDCEVMDIKLEDDIDIIDASKRLSNQMPRGLELVEVYKAQEKMPNYSKAAYTINIENMTYISSKLKDEIMRTLRSGDIIVEKKTKKKSTMVNITDHIYEFEIQSSNENIITFNITLPAGNEFTLKPELVLLGIEKNVADFKPVDIEIHRREILV